MTTAWDLLTQDEVRSIWGALDHNELRTLMIAARNGIYHVRHLRCLIPISALENMGLMCWADHRTYCASRKGECLVEAMR